MTAEIAIFNREAIALAADSAVTMSIGNDRKIKTSAHKIFTLSKCAPVGIMIYNNANILHVPWEVIIKMYREELGTKKFDTIADYTKDFIEYVCCCNLFHEKSQDEFFLGDVSAYFGYVIILIRKEVEEVLKRDGEVKDNEIIKITSAIIKDQHKKFEDAEFLPTLTKNRIRKISSKYGKKIEEMLIEIFEEIPISKSDKNKLKKIGVSLSSKWPNHIIPSAHSGIVIAGFGEKDTFPCLESLHTHGIVEDKLRFKQHVSIEIDYDKSSQIIPFAQGDMVHTFMEGIDPNYKETTESYINKIFEEYPKIIANKLNKYTKTEKKNFEKELKKIGKKLLKDYSENLANYRVNNFISPVTSVVSFLPKDELAAMAESLVNLTSFKQQVSFESETVGGPIDVALISKGDGFIWIKRKHYFKPELNPQFFENYMREVHKDERKKKR